MKNESEPSPHRSMGRGMLTIAWLMGLFLLTAIFGNWEQSRINPNEEPESHTTAEGLQQVVLKKNRYGHYVTTGFINGEEVVFLVDTGASNVSIPAGLARELGLKEGRRYVADTANGPVTVYASVIDRLQIGSIILNHVDASINPGMGGNEILLGMSALAQVEFTHRGNQLTITQRF